VVFRTSTLINIRRCSRIGTARHIGHSWRRPLIGFDRRWWDHEIGETRRHDCGDQNGWNSKPQVDHFFSRALDMRLSHEPGKRWC
jgi:hypothetical protein